MRKAGRGRIGVLRVRRAGRGLKRAGMRLRELGFNVKKGNVAALLPIGVFLVLYLGLGILFEYGMGISMGFYNIPIVVIFLVALLVACFQNRSLSFDDKLVVMGRGIGDKTIVTMILIFMAAGVFVGTVGRDSAESVAYLMLSVIPAEYSVAVLFVVSCFVSLSMGTSVGTITLITPIAVAVAAASGFSLPLCVASVMGGAMFGDNLSFISDTTIAATRTQECSMRDKFRVNGLIAVPAAAAVLGLYLLSGAEMPAAAQRQSVEWIPIIPYLAVLVLAVCGVHVTTVLVTGIVLTGAVGLLGGSVGWIEWIGALGEGIAGMGELIVITLLAGGMLEMIRRGGGIDYLIGALTRKVSGKRTAELSIAALVSMANLCTANNTIAIITTGPIARQIADRFGVDRRKSASLLDSFSCFVQGLIPYGAQLMIAAGLASVSPLEIIGYLYYPMALGICSLLAILLRYPRKYS